MVAKKPRSSVRRFLPDELSVEQISQLLVESQESPSWCNVQPWQVFILSGNSLQRFSEELVKGSYRDNLPVSDFEMPQEYSGVHRERRKESGIQLYQSVGIGKEDRDAARELARENFRFFGAPHLAILCTSARLADYGLLDAGVFIGYFLNVAQRLGIDTIPLASIATQSDIVRGHLNLDADLKVVCGIAFGYSDSTHPINSFRTSRAPIDEVATFLS